MAGEASRVRIVTVTTATLFPEYVAAHPIPVVPQITTLGDASFLQNVNLTYAEFMRRLKSSAPLPKTAASPPGELLMAHGKQLAAAQTILSIRPSGESCSFVPGCRSPVVFLIYK